MDDDEMLVSYQGVTPGLPVLTSDGEQLGILTTGFGRVCALAAHGAYWTANLTENS